MAEDTSFKTFIGTGFETRSIPVEYVVEAETAEEALDRMLEGATQASRETGMGEVRDRFFDIADVRETTEVPGDPEAAAEFDARIAYAISLVTTALERDGESGSTILGADDIGGGRMRITTHRGSFVMALRLEDFS